jgi:hypothetical protein
MSRLKITLMSLLLLSINVYAEIDPSEGPALSEQFLAGNTQGLWDKMTPEMQSAIGSAANLSAFSQQVQDQAGAAGQVLSEDWQQDQGFDIFLRVQEFANSPNPLMIQLAFDSNEKVGGFSVRPQQGEPSQAFEGYQTKTELHLPFKGDWFVFWGGRNREQNYHVDSVDQRYAYDILMMREGKSFEGDPKSLDSYFSFGQKLLAPAGGRVVVALDGLPDQIPGEMDRSNPPGNHVIIDHGNNEYSLLAHLQQGSVKVNVGDVVETGQLLGLCGNSGNTSEPHLHYHLQNSDQFGKGHGLPAPFHSYSADGFKVDKGEPVKGQTVSPQ